MNRPPVQVTFGKINHIDEADKHPDEQFQHALDWATGDNTPGMWRKDEFKPESDCGLWYIVKFSFLVYIIGCGTALNEVLNDITAKYGPVREWIQLGD